MKNLNVDSLMAAALSQWVEADEQTPKEFFEIIHPWMEQASGETWVCPEWWNRTRPEQGIFVWGGDFLRGDRELSHKVWCKLEEIGFECTSSDQCSTCNTCRLLVGTNCDDNYLVTDGAIYCPDCACDQIREAVATSTNNNPLNIHEMLPDWHVAMSRSQILEAFPTHWGWRSEDFGYPTKQEEVFGKFAEFKEKGIPCCVIPGNYRWEWTIVWLEGEKA